MSRFRTPIHRELNRGLRDVVGADSASELARLGLNGVYEIRPGRAFDDAPETPATAAGMAGALTDAVARVAGTWGWE